MNDKLTNLNYEEIDIKYFLNFFNRNKKLISLFSILSFIFACIYSLSLKRVWEGQFQIVLNSEKKLNIDNPFSPTISKLIETAEPNNLKTKVGILQSPSVLMPIYEFVNQNKKINSDNKKLIFSNWKKNLNVELEKDTSILNITYRDTNKEVILPALNKTSSIYQDYSKANRKRSQDLTKKYLLEQIDIYKDRSSNSLRNAQGFAIDQDLIFFNRNVLKTDNLSTDNRLDIISNVDIENIRVNASNEIRMINLKIKKINEISKKDSETLQFIGSTIPSLRGEGLLEELQNIERLLVELRTKYTDNNKPIIKLLEKRNFTIGILKTKAIKYLQASKLELEALKESAMRPKGVLLKYKELLRQALMDESILVGLEMDLGRIKLEQAKEQDPWELITNPTLLDQPVAPSRQKIGLIGLTLGFLISSGLVFFKERKSGILFEPDVIADKLSLPIVDIIESKFNISKKEKRCFFNKFIKNNYPSKIKLIKVGQICIKKIAYFDDLIFNSNNINSNKNISYISQDEKYSNDLNILMMELGKIKDSDINEIKKQKQFFDVNFDGIVFL